MKEIGPGGGEWDRREVNSRLYIFFGFLNIQENFITKIIKYQSWREGKGGFLESYKNNKKVSFKDFFEPICKHELNIT